MNRRTLLFLLNCAAFCHLALAAEQPELVIGEISERTVRLQWSSSDQRSRPDSSILVPFPSTEKLRVREPAGEKEIVVGQLRVTIKGSPPVISVRRPDGKLVQELTFDDGTD